MGCYPDTKRRLTPADYACLTPQALFFPTLRVVVEGYLSDDMKLFYDLSDGFNRWLDDDWGFNRDGRDTNRMSPSHGVYLEDGAVRISHHDVWD